MKPPEDTPDLGIWDKVQNIWTKLVQLFALNEYKVPRLKKRFTHVFDRDKRYLLVLTLKCLQLLIIMYFSKPTPLIPRLCFNIYFGELIQERSFLVYDTACIFSVHI